MLSLNPTQQIILTGNFNSIQFFKRSFLFSILICLFVFLFCFCFLLEYAQITSMFENVLLYRRPFNHQFLLIRSSSIFLFIYTSLRRRKKKKNSYETTDFETVHRRPNLCKSNQSESNILARKNERNLYESKLIFQLNVYSNSTKKVIYIPYKTRVTQ